jgi:hypothetical protein
MFKMVLMLEAMGIYRLIRYKATPTTINTMTRFNNGILQVLLGSGRSIPMPNREAARSAGVRNCAQCSG